MHEAGPWRILSYCSLLSFAFLSSFTEFTLLHSPAQPCAQPSEHPSSHPRLPLSSSFSRCQLPALEEDQVHSISRNLSFHVPFAVSILPAIVQHTTPVRGTSYPYRCAIHSDVPLCSLPWLIHTPFRVFSIPASWRTQRRFQNSCLPFP